MKQVAEGVLTTRSACALAEIHQVEMPICQGVGMLLDGELSPPDVVDYLMSRQLRNETE